MCDERVRYHPGEYDHDQHDDVKVVRANNTVLVGLHFLKYHSEFGDRNADDIPEVDVGTTKWLRVPRPHIRRDRWQLLCASLPVVNLGDHHAWAIVRATIRRASHLKLHLALPKRPLDLIRSFL